eukprot:gene43579-65103_t
MVAVKETWARSLGDEGVCSIGSKCVQEALLLMQLPKHPNVINVLHWEVNDRRLSTHDFIPTSTHDFIPTSTHDFNNKGGICTSADGVHFDGTDCIWLNFTDMHWDTWSNIFYDERSGTYVGTMRAGSDRSGNPCGDRFYPSCVGSKIPGQG